MCDAGTGGKSLSLVTELLGGMGKGRSCGVRGAGDAPCASSGRDTLQSGLGRALGSCEGWELGSAVFNGLSVLSLETSVGSADPGFLCLAGIIHEA